MAETLISPGVFLRENDTSQITQGPITVGAALLGPTVYGPVNIPTLVRSYSDYTSKFGATFITGGANFEYLTSIAALNYFEQGGESLLITRIVSGAYTSATSSVNCNNGTVASASTTPTFANGQFFQLTGSAVGKFFVTSSTTQTDAAPIYYVTTGSDSAGTITNIVAKINGLASTFNITASANTTTLQLTSSLVGTVGNSFSFVNAGSTRTTFTGGTAPTASFVLETISQGAILNNDGGTYKDISTLPSGSTNNIRWEIAFSDTGSGLFTLFIRRGDDSTNSKAILETWSNLSLDPNENNYIGFVIGDQSATAVLDSDGTYYLQYSGSYPNQSRYVRVKSVNTPTPGYLNAAGQLANSSYPNSMPVVGTGNNGGAFSGAAGTTIIAAAMNLYEDIPSSTADTAAENIQGVLGADYATGIGLLQNKDQYDFKTIYAPGLTAQNASSQVSALLSLAQNRGTCIAVVDMVSYGQNIATAVQQSNGFDSSYGAAYYPWVQMRSRETGRLFFCPASTIVPAVYEYSDKISAEWFAPAGLTRGGLTTVIQPERRLTVSQRDTLYSGNINPIAIFPGQGTVIYGQKTLQRKPSALDRVNVRRLLIALKRYIGNIAETLLFEQNTQTTRNNFLNQVNPYLQYVQQKQGLYAFRVIMDDTNNTPDVIDRNQLVGQIYLQPTKTAEYILIDFNILPTGATFGV
jgi:phage tail sheath protein FI